MISSALRSGASGSIVTGLATGTGGLFAGLTLIVGLTHFRNGAQVMIEDYAHGLARKALIVGTVCLSYALMAIGLFALIRLAL